MVDGKYGDIVIVSPAYNVTEKDIDTIVDITGRLIEDVFHGPDTTED